MSVHESAATPKDLYDYTWREWKKAMTERDAALQQVDVLIARLFDCRVCPPDLSCLTWNGTNPPAERMRCRKCWSDASLEMIAQAQGLEAERDAALARIQELEEELESTRGTMASLQRSLGEELDEVRSILQGLLVELGWSLPARGREAMKKCPMMFSNGVPGDEAQCIADDCMWFRAVRDDWKGAAGDCAIRDIPDSLQDFAEIGLRVHTL